MIDSHCHLADAVFADDLEAVVSRAREAGVSQALCILAAGDEAEEAQAARLAGLWPEVRFSVGVHPHQAGAFEGRIDAVRPLVEGVLTRTRGARAVGEIGLDYHYDFSPREVQQAVFRRQVELARDLALPVVIHTREADTDTLRILAEAGEGRLTGVLHCFTGDEHLAAAGVALGLHVSFSGILTFPKADSLRQTSRGIPETRLLVETDSPFLAPPPHRKKRNEPCWVSRVVEVLAETRGRDAGDMARITAENFVSLFRP